ncbi:MAG: hypothetical protein PHT92_06035 [Bacteroidales bacterium]|jgi:hypothetical protein|nr:hypothetical protein [Bacteroidales bacterium]MDY0254905.1 hypothetical protein [Tenuifilaceae bacterium]
MRTIQQVLSTIQRILGLSNSIRNTTKGVKREASAITNSSKTKGKENEIS